MELPWWFIVVYWYQAKWMRINGTAMDNWEYHRIWNIVGISTGEISSNIAWVCLKMWYTSNENGCHGISTVFRPSQIRCRFFLLALMNKSIEERSPLKIRAQWWSTMIPTIIPWSENQTVLGSAEEIQKTREDRGESGEDVLKSKLRKPLFDGRKGRPLGRWTHEFRWRIGSYPVTWEWFSMIWGKFSHAKLVQHPSLQRK